MHELLNTVNLFPEAVNDEIRDCRFPSVDISIKQFIYNRLCAHVINFYKENDSDDEFLLVLGCTINLYYIVGLYSTYGKFDVDRILKYVNSKEVKEYGNLINEFLYSKMVEGILEIQEDIVEDCDLYNETINKMLNQIDDTDLDNLYKAIKKCDRNYVPDIYMLIRENDFERESEEYLKKMISKNPDFRFGLIYCCIKKGKSFYESKGEDVEVLEYKDKLGNDLFFYVMGMKELKKRSIIFSEFGMGIPKIKTETRREFAREYRSKIKECDKKEDVSFEKIRNQVEKNLDINKHAFVEDSPLHYTLKLFDRVEQQKKELELKSRELTRLNEQRKKLIDHLAHSWGNECYPEIVKKVANELLKSGDKILSNKLFKAYNSENNLMGEIIFLQSAMGDDETLKENFQSSFYTSNRDGEKKWKIETLIEEALEELVFSLLYYDGYNKKRIICRERMCIKHSLKELIDDYSKRLEVDTVTESFIDWFTRNIFPIRLKSDECWKEINLGNRILYGKVIIKNFFNELFTNVLFHGGELCEIILDSTDDKMFIKIRNKITNEELGQKKGLESMKEVIKKLNYNTSVTEDEGLNYSIKDGNVFETVIVLAKELMFIEKW